MPKQVVWQDRTVYTGIWKSPVAGRTAIRGTNLKGDGQGDLAGHGGVHRAVLVYQIESYDFWAGELGRTDLEPGAFGENFTVDGLSDDEVCIGDRYRVGDALFEVSQPRVTCFRVGMRLNEPQLPSLLVAKGRPGFYLRVLQEGSVGASDDVELVHRPAHGLTVAEVDALLYLPNRDLGRVADAATCEQLSPGWRQSFNEMLTPARSASAQPTVTGTASPPPLWEGFKTLGVRTVRDESGDVKSFELTDPDGQPLTPAIPGQYLTIRVPAAHAESENRPADVVRSYSLSRADVRDGYRISIKREGAGSARILDVLVEGAAVDVAAPRGNFIVPGGHGPVVLISGGIGITPLLAMLDAVAAEQPEREVVWVHAAQTRDGLLFASEVADRLALLSNSRSRVFLSRETHASDDPDVVAGRLTLDRLRELDLPADAAYCICGPTGFMTSVTDALSAIGVPSASIHQEAFGAEAAINPGLVGIRRPDPHAPADAGDGPLVTFARSGISAGWNPDAYPSLLEFAEACDISARWSCRTGVCHTCLTGLLSGAVAYAPEPLERPEAGQALLCCSTPTTPVVLDA